MNRNLRWLGTTLVLLALAALVYGDISPNNPSVPCDGVAHAFTITNTGQGYGSTRDDALADARSQAKKKSDLEQASIVCESQACQKTIDVTTPDYDSAKPTFQLWPAPKGPGFVASATMSREISVTCKRQ